MQGLKNPHGIAFDPDEPGELYYTEETALSMITVDANGNILKVSRKIIALPRGGRHYTRTIGIGPDSKVYISIGSTCKACIEEDDLAARQIRTDKGGKT
jgi:glucose/arabinose dehydrogenase